MNARTMMLAVFFIVPPAFFLPAAHAADYNEFQNQVYFSNIDPYVVLIAPDTNQSLSGGYNYGFYLIDTHTNRTLNVFYNSTLIGTKANSTKALISEFYPDSKEFYINITTTKNTTLISVHYFSSPNNPPPLPPWVPPPLKPKKAGVGDTITFAEMLDYTLRLIPALIIISVTAASIIYYYKTRTVKETCMTFGDDFYGPGKPNAENADSFMARERLLKAGWREKARKKMSEQLFKDKKTASSPAAPKGDKGPFENHEVPL